MSEDIAKFYFGEVLIGLDHLHKKNIIYRDLKVIFKFKYFFE